MRYRVTARDHVRLGHVVFGHSAWLRRPLNNGLSLVQLVQLEPMGVCFLGAPKKDAHIFLIYHYLAAYGYNGWLEPG